MLAAAAIGGCGSSGSSSSGNGVESQSPAAIVNSARNAIDSAKSVHVAGGLTASGTPLTVDLHLLSGKGGEGQMSASGLGFQVVTIGNTVYINGSQAFWRHFGGNAAAQLFQGKWLKAPTTGTFAPFAALTDQQRLFDQVLSGHKTLTKGTTTTVNGQQAVAVTDSGQGGTIYVATTGPPYPLKITKPGAGGGSVSFSEFNAPVTLTAPAGAVDISQFAP